MNTLLHTLISTYSFQKDQHLSMNAEETNLLSSSGYSPEEIESKFQNSLLWLILPADRPAFLSALEANTSANDVIEIPLRIRHKTGRIILTLNKIRHVVSEEDDLDYYYGIMIDITKHHEEQRAQEKSLEQYQIILSQTENVTFEIDLETDQITFSETWGSLFGYTPNTKNFLATLPANPHIHPADIPTLLQGLNAFKNGENYRTFDIRISTGGQFLWFCLRATAIHDAQGNLSKIVGIFVNIDKQKKETYALKAQAEHDSLTKLLNKTASQKQMEQYLNAFSSGANCALMVIDLDDFKQINDQFGHLFGDKVLLKAAETIQKSFRGRDLVARIGGDEFMVLMKDVTNHELVKERCSQMLKSFQTLLDDENIDYKISCSIGVALSPDHATTYTGLFKCADKAMYDAKKKGKNNFAIYEP